MKLVNQQRDRLRRRAASKRRPKVFGDSWSRGLPTKLKYQIWAKAKTLVRPTEPGKHYGAITAKYLAVLGTLLWDRHNVASGLCMPSYETIAEGAGCARSTVYEAIHALADAGLLTWVHRLQRKGDRVVRTSNGYRFTLLPISTKSELRSETNGQGIIPLEKPPAVPDTALQELAERLRGRLSGLRLSPEALLSLGRR